MFEIVEILQNVIELGLIYGLVVLSMYITSKIIYFDDLTVEGSFAIGGATCAQLLVLGLNPWLSLPLIIISGCILGLCTGLLHTKLNMNNLISGLVATTAVWSINLKIAGPNIALPFTEGIFDFVLPQILEPYRHILLLTIITFGIFTLVRWFLTTEIGFMLKAVGSNPQMLTNLGKSIDFYKILALIIANGITAFAGSLFVQHAGFFSITGSIGTMIVALAGLIISSILKNLPIYRLLFGAIAYQAIFAITIELQLDPAWNKLITALLIVVLIISRKAQKKAINWR